LLKSKIMPRAPCQRSSVPNGSVQVGLETSKQVLGAEKDNQFSGSGWAAAAWQRRGSTWACARCDSSVGLQRDPADLDKSYCSACWASWEKPRSQGRKTATSGVSACARCGSPEGLQPDPADLETCCCPICWASRQKSHDRNCRSTVTAVTCSRCGSLDGLTQDPKYLDKCYCSDCWVAREKSQGSKSMRQIPSGLASASCARCGAKLADDGKCYCSACWSAWKQGTAATSTAGRSDCEVPLGDIQFSQSSISASFRDGQTLDATIDLLRDDACVIHQIPRIRVVRHQGKLVTMDNRRLYCFRMAFQDEKLVPVALFTDKASYGCAEFDSKLSTICGGHQVHIVGDKSCTKEVSLPAESDWFVRPRLRSIQLSIGAKLHIVGKSLLRVVGTQRQVEDALRKYNRDVLDKYKTCSVALLDRRVQGLIVGKKGANAGALKNRFPCTRLTFGEDDHGIPVAWISGLVDEVDHAQHDVSAMVTKFAVSEEQIVLPLHSGRFFCKALRNKLLILYSIDEESGTMRISGTAEQRCDARREVEELISRFSCKTLEVPGADAPRLQARLIGPKGSNIKQLVGDTTVQVEVAKSEGTVHILGFQDEVGAVYARVRAFLLDNTRIQCPPLTLLPDSYWFVAEALKYVKDKSRAHIFIEGQVVSIKGNREQVGVAEDMLMKLLYKDFHVRTFIVNSNFVKDLIGKGGSNVKTLSDGRNIWIDFPERPDVSSTTLCRSGYEHNAWRCLQYCWV